MGKHPSSHIFSLPKATNNDDVDEEEVVVESRKHLYSYYPLHSSEDHPRGMIARGRLFGWGTVDGWSVFLSSFRLLLPLRTP